MNLFNKILAISSITALAFADKASSQEQIIDGIESTGKIGMLNNFKDVSGAKLGLFTGSSKAELGYVIEFTHSSNEYARNVQFMRFGFEFNYFPSEFKRLNPYIGSGIKYGHMAYFTDGEEKYHKVKGLRIEGKAGAEFLPLKQKSFKIFSEVTDGFSFDKKTKDYPLESQLKNNKSAVIIGLKFYPTVKNSPENFYKAEY